MTQLSEIFFRRFYPLQSRLKPQQGMFSWYLVLATKVGLTKLDALANTMGKTA